MERNQEDIKLLTAVRTLHDSEDVHFKVQKFYSFKILELSSEINRMSLEYDKQIDSVETEYFLAKNELKQVRHLRHEEQERFDRREREMKDYQELKQKRAADKKLLEFQKLKVVVIQAWS
jgi:hypothetical protein